MSQTKVPAPDGDFITEEGLFRWSGGRVQTVETVLIDTAEQYSACPSILDNQKEKMKLKEARVIKTKSMNREKLF